MEDEDEEEDNDDEDSDSRGEEEEEEDIEMDLTYEHADSPVREIFFHPISCCQINFVAGGNLNSETLPSHNNLLLALDRLYAKDAPRSFNLLVCVYLYICMIFA